MKTKLLFLFAIILSVGANGSSSLMAQIPEDIIWSQYAGMECHSPVIFSNGKTFVNSGGQFIQIRSLTDGELLKQFIGVENDIVKTIAVSPDSKYIFAGAGRDPFSSKVPFINMLEIETSEIVKAFHPDQVDYYTCVSSLDVSTDGLQLAAILDSKYSVNDLRDLTLFIWDIETSEIIKKEKWVNEKPRLVKYSPDGKYLAVSNFDKVVLYKLPGLKEMYVLGFSEDFHKDPIKNITFSSDSKFLVSIDSRYAKIWDINTNKLLTTIDCNGPGEVLNVGFENNNKFIITGGNWLISTRIFSIESIEDNNIIYSYNDTSGSSNGITITDSNNLISMSGNYIRYYKGRFHDTPVFESNNISIETIYPNPTNNRVFINFEQPISALTKILLYNENGHEIDTIFEGFLEKGNQEHTFDCTSLPMGLYFISIQSGNDITETYKLIKQ